MVAIILPIVLLTTFDQRGPVTSISGAPKVDQTGIQLRRSPEVIDPNEARPRIGQWIWTDSVDKASVVRFRKLVSIEKSVGKVRAWISADTRYRIWVNGHLASRGPADIGRDYDSQAPGPWFDDRRDLSRFFKPGVNAIAVEVFGSPIVQNEGTTGSPGFKIDIDAGNRIELGSDTTWRCSPAQDLEHHDGPNGFRIDLTKEPVGWQLVGFDDSNWSFASIVKQSRVETIVSELPEPMEAVINAVGTTRVSQGVTVNKDGGARFDHDGSYTVRFGKVYSAYLGLKVRGHSGARLILMPNEPDQPGYHRKSEIVLREGVQVIELPYMDSFSVVNIAVEGVREPIEILDVRPVFTSYPVRYRGSFECSNQEYNRLWQTCRWVTQICMQTHFLDSPHHQEPICDPGDYLIESQNAFYAFGDGVLAKQDLRKFARILVQRDYQNFHTSYALLWLRMLVQYVVYSGDRALLVELAPVVRRLIDKFDSYIGKNGLISEAPNYMFMDWVEIEGFNAHHPPAVIGQGYMTALYYRALLDDIRVAQELGDKERIALSHSRRDKLKVRFNEELWDSQKSLYRDGTPFQTHVSPGQWLPADKDSETFSAQVNVLAVSCGLADPTRSQAVMRTVMARRDLNCQPYFMHFVFEALDTAGLFDELASAQIDRWKVIPDTQSFREMWDTGDYSHAWNATPMVQLSSRVLGVRPLEPGFKKFAVDPSPLGLEWAKRKVPTPWGDIDVSWVRKLGRIELTFVVPKNSKALCKGVEYGQGRHKVSWHLSTR